MTAHETKAITGERIASFLPKYPNDPSDLVTVSKLQIEGTPEGQESYALASTARGLRAAPAIMGRMTLQTYEDGVREIMAVEQGADNERRPVSSEVLAMFAEAAFHQDVLDGINYPVKATIPRESETTRMYYETLGMRPTYIAEGDTEVTMRADARIIRGFADHALRKHVLRRLADAEISTRPRTAWDEEVA